MIAGGFILASALLYCSAFYVVSQLQSKEAASQLSLWQNYQEKLFVSRAPEAVASQSRDSNSFIPGASGLKELESPCGSCYSVDATNIAIEFALGVEDSTCAS